MTIPVKLALTGLIGLALTIFVIAVAGKTPTEDEKGVIGFFMLLTMALFLAAAVWQVWSL